MQSETIMNQRTTCTPELKVTLGKPWTIASAGVAGGKHIFPMLWRLRDGTLLLGYHIDLDICRARRVCLRSVDNGKTWTLDPPRVLREDAMVQLRDGTVLVYDGHTHAVTPGSKQAKGVAYHSRDGGRTFQGPIEVTVNMPKACVLPGPDKAGRPYGAPEYRGPVDGIGEELCFWGEGLELPDGSVLATSHVYFEGDPSSREVAVISKDQGLTFDCVSTVGHDQNRRRGGPDRYEGYSEGALSWTSAGDILCMMRIGQCPSRECNWPAPGQIRLGQCKGTPMHQARSSDYGRTWSKPTSVGVCSVDPDLALMSNGVLVCSYGRPGNFIMFDPTGTGDHWQEPILVQWGGGATGYTGIREIAPGKLLHVYDDKCVDEVSGGVANCLRGIEITVERQ